MQMILSRQNKIAVIATACNMIGIEAEEFHYIWWDIGRKLRDIEYKKIDQHETEEMMEYLREVL